MRGTRDDVDEFVICLVSFYCSKRSKPVFGGMQIPLRGASAFQRRLGVLGLLLTNTVMILSDPQVLEPSTSGWRTLIEGAAPSSSFVLMPGRYSWGRNGGCNVVLPDGASIVASQQGSVVIDCSGSDESKHFIVPAGMSAHIQGCDLVNGSTAGNGGCIEVGVGGSLIARQTVFEYCSAQGSGGALFLAADTTLDLEDATMSKTSAAADGGAIYLGPGSVAVARNISFHQSSAENGAAVHSKGASLNMTRGVKVVECKAASKGGGFCLLDGSHVSISGGNFKENFAGESGGVAYLEQSCHLMLILGITVEGSVALRGAAFYAREDSSINLQDAVIRWNVADGELRMSLVCE